MIFSSINLRTLVVKKKIIREEFINPMIYIDVSTNMVVITSQNEKIIINDLN